MSNAQPFLQNVNHNPSAQLHTVGNKNSSKVNFPLFYSQLFSDSHWQVSAFPPHFYQRDEPLVSASNDASCKACGSVLFEISPTISFQHFCFFLALRGHWNIAGQSHNNYFVFLLDISTVVNFLPYLCCSLCARRSLFNLTIYFSKVEILSAIHLESLIGLGFLSSSKSIFSWLKKTSASEMMPSTKTFSATSLLYQWKKINVQPGDP
jgi:hypothetical protein